MGLGLPPRASLRGKRRIVYEDFAVKNGDPQIIQAILGRRDLNLAVELRAMNNDSFNAFKSFVAKNKSMERIVDRVIAEDRQMRELEVGKRDYSPTRADPHDSHNQPLELFPKNPPKLSYKLPPFWESVSRQTP